MKIKIAVLGDGGWGTTLAVHLAKKGLPVCLWGAFKDYAALMDKKRLNPKFLPGIKIPSDIRITADLKEAIDGAGVVVAAVPSHFFRGVIRRLKKFKMRGRTVLSVTKGIEDVTLLRMSQIIGQELNGVRIAVLSGPTIAREVATGVPTTAVIASYDSQTAKKLQKIFNSDKFRIYTNSDLVGVELGGSLKNIIAIACGVSDGLGFGTNTKAAILCRGLAEISRLGRLLGSREKTFAGLSGLGDLVTTCISPFSRNRYVGEQLGRGRRLKEILKRMDMIAEGVETTKSVYKLSVKHRVVMPITTEVYNILYRNKNSLTAVKDLMGRSLKAE